MKIFTEKDFMVGDWLFYGETCTNQSGDYDVQFYAKRITLDDFKFWADNDWTETDFREFTNPIPLTEELLMHNFPKPDLIVWWKNDDGSGTFHIESGLDDDGFRFSASIKYLHELQHLLHAFGIDYAIEYIESQDVTQ